MVMVPPTCNGVVLTMAAEMKHRLGVPYRKICDFFSTYCDLTICPATLVCAEQRLTDLALPTYDLLIEALRQAEVVHADETGWRIGRLNALLWVFSNQEVTVYAVRQSRGHELPEAILGPDFDGWLIVDGLASYTVLEYAKGQCNGHLLRRAKFLRDQVPQGEVPLLDELSHLLQEGIDLAQRREDLSETGYRRRVAELGNRLAAWVMARPTACSNDLRRLHRHLCNPILKMLRPAVITRKVGGCNKSLWGGLVPSVLASIMVTCQQQGQTFLELARRLWQGGEPQAVPLVPAPEP